MAASYAFRAADDKAYEFGDDSDFTLKFNSTSGRLELVDGSANQVDLDFSAASTLRFTGGLRITASSQVGEGTGALTFGIAGGAANNRGLIFRTGS